jgi:hypothetical protein
VPQAPEQSELERATRKLGGKYRSKDPEVRAAARREYELVRSAKIVADLVASAPPMTEATRAQLRQLLYTAPVQ